MWWVLSSNSVTVLSFALLLSFDFHHCLSLLDFWVRAPQTLRKEQCVLVEPLEGLSTVAVARSLGIVCRDRVPIKVRNLNHFFILFYEVMRPLLYSLLKTLTFRNLLKLLLSKTGQVLLKLVSTNY